MSTSQRFGAIRSITASPVRVASLALSLALAAGLLASPLAARAAKPEADPSLSDAQPHPVLDRIRSSGRIVLAHRESSVPFSYFDANKQPVGYALDLCKDVAEAVRKHLGLKTLAIAYLPITTATRIDAIATGKADLECGATTNNAERRQKVAFTIPHYITGSRYAVRSDSTITELEGFEDHVLVSTAGSTPFKSIDQANRDRLIHIDVRAVPDNAKAMEMLANKTADGFAMDDVQLYGLIAGSPDPSKFKVVGKFLTIEPLAIMLSKDDAAFKKVVDDEMRHVIRSGEAEKIYNRWFLKPIPPKNTSMSLPMSYLLRDSWKYPSDAVAN
ncbi:MAG: amino acid ABC transporter substrate-binding protein [Betaproteobacteria bacterium]